MASPTAVADDPALSVHLPARRVLGIWLKHLVSLYFLLIALCFVWTGPHPWYVAPAFMLFLVWAHQLDAHNRIERRQPVANMPAWPFDALVLDRVMDRNAEFQLAATEELARRELGPFGGEDPAEGDPASVLAAARAAEEEAKRRPRGALRRALARSWRRLPAAARVALVLAMIAFVSAAGVQWETGGEGWTLIGRTLFHGWMLAVIAGAIRVMRALKDRELPEIAAFGAAFAVMIAVGWLTSQALAAFAV